MAHEVTAGCRFTTDRLLVEQWHDVAARHGHDLVEIVCSVVTANTTAALPADWAGDFDADRARRWIDSRDAESPTLLVIERATRDAIGVVILYEDTENDEPGSLTVRVGYVLAEAAWGMGVASELVGGLVAWARSEPRIGSLEAGVSTGNDASTRVLLKNGFCSLGERGGEQFFTLAVG